VGAPLTGRVLIIDDVISAGTSVRQSVEIIKAAGAVPCGVVIALDRMERGSSELSAVQEVERYYRIPVVSVATLDDLVRYLQTDTRMDADLAAVSKYREKYGVTANA
jgi:orotate phosphoribosyltransferase